jgi:hypothetical protein
MRRINGLKRRRSLEISGVFGGYDSQKLHEANDFNGLI